jgi:hypothetical protein
MLYGIHIPDNSIVLEPTAGSGDLVKGVLEKYDAIVDCIELNEDRYNILVDQGFNALHANFLKVEPTKLYDFVIACPTYKDSADLVHIMHMYKFLKPNGRIISLTHPIWTVGDSFLQLHFRSWLSDKKYSMRMLTDLSYVENFKTQPSMIIDIRK